MFAFGRTQTVANSRINTLILIRSRVFKRKSKPETETKNRLEIRHRQDTEASIPHLVVDTKINLQRESRVRY